jgi:hypothetical protein
MHQNIGKSLDMAAYAVALRFAAGAISSHGNNERVMKDGFTQLVEISVQCPKCHQESTVRVATGNEVENIRKSIVCAYCQNPWIEFLPGQLVSGPFEQRKRH